MTKFKWYEKGLRFKCTGCGKCCTGGPGFVWLSKADVGRLAKHLKITTEVFKQKYTRQIGERLSLLEDSENYDCVFLKKGKFCGVYNERPMQCRTYPFWPEIMANKKAWDRESSRCEGINHRDAPLVPIEEIKKQQAILQNNFSPNYKEKKDEEPIVKKLDPTIQVKVDQWLQGPYDDSIKNEIKRLLKEDQKTLIDSFYTDLAFGTGGMRGIMGVGTNRLNRYTIRNAAQGLANYLLKQPKKNGYKVVIGYDSRFNSKFFAEEAARVLAGNAIDVFITQDLRPTPFVSFACRDKQCDAAVMITASHNPPEYNGFKVYWNDGSQVVPPHDIGIMEEVHKIRTIEQVKLAESDHPRIQILNHAIDKAYIEAIAALQNTPDQNKKYGKDLNIVFSNLHGTGITLLPDALKSWGFPSLSLVEKQMKPDGNFPTAHSPNPEEKKALYLGIQDLEKLKADLLLTTDPDADRIGVVVMHKNKPVILTGNEIATICIEYLCKTLKEQNRLPKNGAFVTTIVSSNLLKVITQSYKIACFEVLTGFKYIGEKIHEWELSKNGYDFIFGAEESHGYLYGTHARDKDAIVSACLICEIASNAKKRNETLVDILHQIYDVYGIYRAKQLAIAYEASQESMEQMKALMHKLRENPPKTIDNVKVSIIEDYKTRIKQDLDSDLQEKLTLPKSNVLLYRLADGSKFVIRPSGTEPKIKIYGMVSEREFSTIEEGIKKCDFKLEKRLNEIKEKHLS